MRRKRGWGRRILRILIIMIAVVAILAALYAAMTRIRVPEPEDRSATLLEVRKPSPGFLTVGNNWLRKSKSGLWELYVEGRPFERGVITGKLTQELIADQEQAFIDQIQRLVPSPSYLKFLKYFTYWFNRNLDEYIPEEYQEEIYGISLSAPQKFNFIGSPYKRMLNYHSAHDIGHTLQNMHLVGCTSFGTWGSLSKDSSLIIGRNFDFYVGEEFRANRIVCFEKPDRGHPFVMITWGGMTGAVSGMNVKGVTVTINAAPSGIPWSARTPVSILAREILQYASNIREAMDIAQKRETFVSESFLVGSAADHKAVVIEKTPDRTELFETGRDYIVCTNHFQSPVFRDLEQHAVDRRESPSVYRFKRVVQEITDLRPVDPTRTAQILRDRSGLNGKPIGMENEKAINQLICHHSVIFEPSKGRVWVSTDPYQLGAYTCYDIFKIFNTFAGLQHDVEIVDTALSIPADPFLSTVEYSNLAGFRKMRDRIREAALNAEKLNDPTMIAGLIRMNPDYYEGYEIAGDYFTALQQSDSARYYYGKSLEKEIPRQEIKRKIALKLFSQKQTQTRP